MSKWDPANMTAACFGGMLFGWDIGAIGGILVMKPFQVKYGLPTGSSAKEKKVTADLNANSKLQLHNLLSRTLLTCNSCLDPPRRLLLRLSHCLLCR